MFSGKQSRVLKNLELSLQTVAEAGLEFFVDDKNRLVVSTKKDANEARLKGVSLSVFSRTEACELVNARGTFHTE